LGTSTIVTEGGISTFLQTKILVTGEAVYFHAKGWEATVRIPYERITSMFSGESDKLLIEADGTFFKGILIHCVRPRKAISTALSLYGATKFTG
jgi:hypothetical protein